ncbi:hypothetical protein SRB521_00929 [Intestinimonas butyriciproducens]|nr:hypothetical protein SRB521_00929 [Intestinimonas butyriciproducens]
MNGPPDGKNNILPQGTDFRAETKIDTLKKLEVDRLTRRSTSNLIKNIPQRPIL